MSTVETYDTLDAGKKAFRVTIIDDVVSIYDLSLETINQDTLEYNEIKNKPKLVLTIQTLLVGSPSEGTLNEGNVIIVEIEPLNYYYIGATIFKFTTQSPLIELVSNVGNNKITTPYAIDETKSYYLFNNFTIISGAVSMENPYLYFNDNSLITEDRVYQPPRQPSAKTDIVSMYIGSIRYTARWVSNPGEEYDRITKRYNRALFIEYVGQQKTQITRDEYIEIMNNFGKLMGYVSLEYTKVTL